MVAAGSSAGFATTSANARDFGEAGLRTTIDSTRPSFAKRSSILSSRSRSAIRTFDPESSSPYSSSGPDHDGADRLAGPEARHPLRIVAHPDRDAIALFNTDGFEVSRKCRNLTEMIV